MKTLRKFLSPIKEHPIDYFWNTIGALIVSGYTITSIEITKKLLINVQDGNKSELIFLLGALILIAIFTTILRLMLHKKGWSPIMHNGISLFIERYMRRFITAEGSAIDKIGTGKFITIIDKGLHDWFDMLFEFTYNGIINIVFIIYAIYSIFSVSIVAGICSILLFILALIVATFANYKMKSRRDIRRDAYKDAIHTMTVLFMSRNEVLQNESLFHQLISRIHHFLNKAKNAHHLVAFWFVIMEEFPKDIIVFIRVGVYIFMSIHFWNHSGSIAELAIFITIISIAEKSLNELLNLLRNGLRLFSFIELFWKTFDELPIMKGYDSGSTFSSEDLPIEIQNITYGYNESKVFENFSLTLEKGKKTALVGASGGGKTTLMKLIAGYLHPESGSISVMGNILSETALKTYYPHIGYLTQDPGVFDATIRENLISAISSVSDVSSRRDHFQNQEGENDNQNLISKGKRDSSVSLRNDKTKNIESTISSITVSQDERLINALKLAQCDFVFELEHGLDTEIGERGVRLSGGQKQRLAIAKIFLKDPEIILLDEPTSALDSFSEEKITEALDTLFKNRTVIIVAHRLQTVKKADDIIVIEGGEVIERGTHTELVEKGGVYNRMLELQSGF